ncbi:uncharacterized protein LOC114462242 [Gouania willdenowi]|uniref:uncharacterized protein LOC114462242 n=1 Tax=Gouania willdenowi TaxID=441366 RepID=UPI001054ADD0|nr:uncharacterized protein LOC114462242 [Gouania willdenowi]
MLGTQATIETAQATKFNAIFSSSNKVEHTVYTKCQQINQETSNSWMEIDNANKFSSDTFSHNGNHCAFNKQTVGVQHTDLFENIALPDGFLNDYYSQKAMCTFPLKDSLLEYDFEGQGSSAGSVGCCSLLDSDSDLTFHEDFGPKFKKLAEICSPPTTNLTLSLMHTAENTCEAKVDADKVVLQPKLEHVQVEKADIKIANESFATKHVKSSVSVGNTGSSNINCNTNHSATSPISTQTIVLQQPPVYYATNPVLPMHFTIQPHLQNQLLLANGLYGTSLPGLCVIDAPHATSNTLINRADASSMPVQEIVSPLLASGFLGGPQSPGTSVLVNDSTSAVGPAMLLPFSSLMSQDSVVVEGFKAISPNTDDGYMLLQKKPESGDQVLSGPSPGFMLRGASLKKKAAPPQGDSGSAAQETQRWLLQHVAYKGRANIIYTDFIITWIGHAQLAKIVSLTFPNAAPGQQEMDKSISLAKVFGENWIDGRWSIRNLYFYINHVQGSHLFKLFQNVKHILKAITQKGLKVNNVFTKSCYSNNLAEKLHHDTYKVKHKRFIISAMFIFNSPPVASH